MKQECFLLLTATVIVTICLTRFWVWAKRRKL
jgi:hypothetical protein